MEPMIISLICVAVFGTVIVITTMVRQLLLSRDKKLNDEAQSRALTQEAAELEKIRMQMQNSKRFVAHYTMLGANKEAIKYLDSQIDKILNLKTQLVERFIQAMIKESGTIINNGEVSLERKVVCDKLREEVDSKIAFFNEELKNLQIKRSNLWDCHIDFQKHLLDQEKSHNDSLDRIYKQHSAMLEKVYLRHIANSELVAVKSIEAGTISFKDMLMSSFQFLIQFFGGSTVPTIALVQTRVEHRARVEVEQMERSINYPASNNNAAAQYPTAATAEIEEQENRFSLA